MTMPDRVLASVTLPLSGAISPVSSLSKVVLPAPLGPTRPIRSPRWMRRVKSRMIGALAEALEDLLGVDHGLRADIVLGQRELGRARRAEHRRALGAHLVELGSRPWLRRRRAVTPRCSQ